jgi:hypothetical protein
MGRRTCLIEADRERETPPDLRDFNAAAVSTEATAGPRIQPGERAAIIMTMIKWPFSLQSFSPAEFSSPRLETDGIQLLVLLARPGPDRRIPSRRLKARRRILPSCSHFLVTEAPPARRLRGAQRWEDAGARAA